jgi:uncharacterized protein
LKGAPTAVAPELTPGAAEALRKLKTCLEAHSSMIVGFSGGADSALLLKAAVDALGSRVLAVTAVSPSLPKSELDEARAVAAEIGARHKLVDSHEMDEAGYRENSPRRCYFCKAELFDILKAEASLEGADAFAYGAITDDLGDFRPGMDAAKEAGALAPLIDAGISKGEVRELSRYLGLTTWDKPASACLSSRIPFGRAIDPALLAKVESAEALLHAEGMRQVRLRDHGDIARIECIPDEFALLQDPARRSRVVAGLQAIGYRFITLDLQGYRTGSLNPTDVTK